MPDLVAKFHWLKRVAADPQLPPTALKVALHLADHFNNRTGEAWPSQARLATLAGLSDRCVRKILSALVQRGHLAVADGWRHRAHIYQMAQQNDGSVDDRTRNERSDYDAEPGTGVPRSRNGRSDKPSYEPLDTPKACVRGGDAARCARRAPPNAHAPSARALEDGGAERDQAFGQFWAAFPKKAGRLGAQREFNRLITNGEATAEDLIAGAMRYAAARTDKPERYSKEPTHWLRNGHWADEPAPSEPERPARKPSRNGRHRNGNIVEAFWLAGRELEGGQ